MNKVASGGERVVLRQHGRVVAGIVPAEDLQLLVELETRMDLQSAHAALKKEGPRVDWNRRKDELGL